MIKIYAMGFHFANFGGVDINRKDPLGSYLFLFFRTPVSVYNGKEYELVEENTFYIYSPKDIQRYRKDDGHFVNDWMHFTFDKYNRYFEKLGLPLNTPIRIPDYKEVNMLYEQLHSEFFNNGSQHEYMMDSLCNLMFHRLSEKYQISLKFTCRQNEYQIELRNIRSRILSYEYRPKGVSEIAEKLGLSISYLQHLYKSFFGNSINQDIITGKINRAANLIMSTNSSVSEIAKECGYDNLEHFSRQFKAHTGMSPTTYRKEKQSYRT